MKLDVYIPTYPPHFPYLNKVVDMYLKSTEKAENIIISVSGYKDVNKIFFAILLILVFFSLINI